MPFIKRKSTPVNVSQVKVDKDVAIDDDLECIANYTLCGVIQQLSNLNHNASGLFDELCSEALAIYTRANNLKTKVDGMKERYKKWNKIKAGASFDKVDIENDTPLSQHFDQQLLSQGNRPAAIMSMHMSANPPPDFTKTNQYRDDGKNGLTYYTDPTFFFVTWSSEMQKIEKEHQNRKIRRHERKTRSHDDEHRPREVKRKQDELRDKANRAQFSEVEQPSKRKRRKKKKKMEGFSNVAWDNQHKNSKSRNEIKTTMQDLCENHQDSRNEEQNEVNNSVPCSKEHLPDNINQAPLHTRKPHAMQNGVDLPVQPNFDELPPPPIDLELPPPQPDLPQFTDVRNDQRFTLPPAPPDFFGSQTQSVINDWSSNFPLPPPPIDIEETEPPPPLQPRRSQTRNDLQSKRISTFVFSMGNNSELAKSTTNQLQLIAKPQTNGPLLPAPPVAPPPPPPPMFPQGLPSTPIANGLSTSTSKTSDDDSGGVPTENALLAMKQKLQTKERKIKPPPVASTNAFDVHTIMNNALESHRKFIEDSSSEDESEFTDSDSDWD